MIIKIWECIKLLVNQKKSKHRGGVGVKMYIKSFTSIRHEWMSIAIYIRYFGGLIITLNKIRYN